MLLRFADWCTYNLMGISRGSHLGGMLNFFIYDSVKILLLLFVMIFVMGVVRTYLSQHKIREWMAKRGIIGNFFASLFGSITPFCSCSSIPIFLGFLEADVPLGVTFSFLITSPLINEYLVVLMFGFFGWKITALYIVSGLLIGTLTGMVLGRMNLERHLVEDLIDRRESLGDVDDPSYDLAGRVKFGYYEAVSVVKKIWLWILVGVGMGALIHNYVPQEMIQSLVGKAGIFSVPIATIIGVPMYGSCAAIIPIAVVLFHKGMPLGTALSFMMAIVALSLPEAIMLRWAMTLKLIGIFFGITTVGIIFTGYMFNFLQHILA